MTFTIYKNNREPSVTTQVTSGGVPVDLTGLTAKFRLRDQESDTLKVDADATIFDSSNGRVKYDWITGDTDTPGEYLGWFTIINNGREQDTPEIDIDILEHGGTLAGALCSVEDVRDILQLSATEHGQDDAIRAAIKAASKALQTWTGREFLPTTGATRTITYRGGGILDPVPYDLRSITQIQDVTTATAPLTLVSGSDYYPLPADPDGIILAGFPLLTNYRSYTAPRVRQLEITGDWGFASIPADIRQAAAMTAASWVDRSTSDYAAVAAGEVIDPTADRGSTYAIPPAAKSLARPYRRIPVA